LPTNDRLDDLRSEKGEPDQPTDVVFGKALALPDLRHRRNPANDHIVEPAERPSCAEESRATGAGAASARNESSFYLFVNTPQGLRATRASLMITFGEFVMRRRKELGLTQKEVAARITQDDGKVLSVQYLNDIEHGRRGAPPDYFIKQLAKALRTELDVVYFRAGRLPYDIRSRSISDERALAAFQAFRRALRRRRKKT